MMKRPNICVAIALSLSACGGGSNDGNGDTGAAGEPGGAANGTAGTSGIAGGSFASGPGALGGGVGGSTASGIGNSGIGGGSGGGCPVIVSSGSSSNDTADGGLAGDDGVPGGETADGGMAGDDEMPGGDGPECTATFAAPVDPLSLDATLDCRGRGLVTSVAASATRGFLAYTYSDLSTLLVTIMAPDQVAQELAPPLRGRVIADPVGAPMLIGLRSPDFAAIAFRQDATGSWQQEALPPVVAPHNLWGARFGADGRAHVIFNNVLMTRSTGGVWSDTVLPGTSTDLSGGSLSALAVDSMEGPHVVYRPWRNSFDELIDWRPNQTPVMFSRLEQARHLEAAAAGSGRIAVAAQNVDGIHLFVPDGSAGVHSQLLPGTQRADPTGCPSLSACTVVPPTPCTARADSVPAFALAATGSADVWLAYLSKHVDEDRVQSCSLSGSSLNCRSEITADRSTAELILMRIPNDGAPAQASDIRWRAPVSRTTFHVLAMDARGSELTLVSMSSGMSERRLTHYMVIDTTKL